MDDDSCENIHLADIIFSFQQIYFFAMIFAIVEGFEQLWDQFDNSETDKLRIEKMNLCHEMLKLASEVKKTEIQLELDLIWLFFGLQQILTDTKNVSYEKLSPHVESFTNKCNTKALVYYKKRKKDTGSLLNKSRYALACWLIQKKKGSALIEEAISSMISCSIGKMKENEPIDTVHLFVPAFNLAKVFGVKKFNASLIDGALKIFYSFVDTDHARWMIEPIEVFAQLAKKPNPDLVNEIMTILHREAHRFCAKNNPHLERSLLEASLELCRHTNLEPSLREQLKMIIHSMIAESYERGADKANNPDGAIAAIKFYRDAQLEYENAGNHLKVRELDRKIREASEKIQWKEISHTVEIPDLQLKGNNGYELVVSFCEYSGNIPSVNWAAELTNELSREYPISDLVRSITFNRKNPLSYGDIDESVSKSKIDRQVIMAIHLAEMQLSRGMKKLESEKKVTESDFVSFLKDTGLYDTDQLSIIKAGIHEHFNGNYITSIHVLIPQIEGMLRLLLKSKGISTLKKKGEIIMDNELGGLLAKSEVEDILGKDFTNYLKVKYSNPDGINLRNNVSHALSLLSDFNYEISLTIIHTICKIARLSVKK